jgi:hypothetical protein
MEVVDNFRKEHIIYIMLFVVFSLETSLLFGSMFLKNINIIYILLSILFVTITAFKMTMISSFTHMIRFIMYSSLLIIPFVLYSTIYSIYEKRVKKNKKSYSSDSFLTTASIISSIIFIVQTVIYTYGMNDSSQTFINNQNVIYHLLQVFLFIINTTFGGFILRDLYFYHTDG